MGKGGNATVAFSTNTNVKSSTHSTTLLETERKEKMNSAPDFHWASGDSLEEPHVKRYVECSKVRVY